MMAVKEGILNFPKFMLMEDYSDGEETFYDVISRDTSQKVARISFGDVLSVKVTDSISYDIEQTLRSIVENSVSCHITELIVSPRFRHMYTVEDIVEDICNVLPNWGYDLTSISVSNLTVHNVTNVGTERNDVTYSLKKFSDIGFTTILDYKIIKDGKWKYETILFKRPIV